MVAKSAVFILLAILLSASVLLKTGISPIMKTESAVGTGTKFPR